ncbi:MAG TPA: hypothetical protein VII53_04895 [Solirubrobacteraceae bacterium]
MRRTTVLIALGALAVMAPSAQAAVTIESFTAGAASTLAGAHADASTAFHFENVYTGTGEPRPLGGEPAQIVVKLPPGVVGDPQNVARCLRALFANSAIVAVGAPGTLGGCPASTMVGEATVLVSAQAPVVVTPLRFGVYNVQPGPGEPAELGIQGIDGVVPITVPIQVSASAADNYALTATVPQVPRMPYAAVTLASSLTLWGVPAAHQRYDGNSNPNVINAGEPTFEDEATPPAPPSQWKPFMENPTGCSTTPLTTLRVNTYEEPEVFSEALATSPIPTDCAHVPFAPSISLQPSPASEGGTTQAGAPTGLSVDLHLPQGNDPNGRGTAELEKAVVTLPAGMTVSPSAASKGLEACTDVQFAAKSDSPAACPPGSVIGEDEVESPLVLSAPLKGNVYLGQPLSTDPTSGRMFRVFQELQGFGLDIKLQGSVTADPSTGQLTATFANLPELPFEDFRLRFKGGPNAVLVNPPVCAQNATATTLYPYSGNSPATPPASFATSYDGNGAPCPASLPFAPSAAVSTASSQAGALSPLSVTFSRADETQPLGRIDAKLPAGLLGYVSGVPLCNPTDAAAGSCPASSRVGVVSTTAGAGSNPLTVPGTVYLAQGTGGYPFALSVVVPAVAGPYDLGNVVVLVNLQVNSDGSITAVSGPLPSILDGIPLDIRSVTLTTDRPGFTFLPTNCAPLSMSGTLTSLSGTLAPISAPFQASGCGSLPFAPSFTVATQGSTSKANGASLTVRVAQKPGEADIHSVHVELPIQLPSRLTTLQKACTAAQFNSNPAGCPPGSVVGTATAITPTLSSPLTGPAILVSHGGAAFPDLEIVLQGEGVTVILDGVTDIKKSVTSSTFAAVPDVPISGFELTLPEGPYSILGAYIPAKENGSMCAQKLIMPTAVTGQNGVVVKQSTRIAVSGCPKVKVISAKVKGATASLTVRVPAAGRLAVSGSGLKHAGMTVRRAGNVTVQIGPTTAGLASLHRHHRLKVRLKASFTPSSGSGSSVSTTVTFR